MIRFCITVSIILINAFLYSEPLTLSECFDLSLKYNPKQTAACYQVKAAKEEALIKQAPYYPEIYVSAHGFKWQTHNFLQFPLPPPLPPINVLPSLIGPTEDYGYLFSGRYTLFDFGEAKQRYLAARAGYGAASFERQRIKEEILLNVAILFFQLASNQELVGVAKENLIRRTHHLDLVQEKREAGTAPLADSYRSKVDVAEAKLTLVRTESQVSITEARLKEALGLDYDYPLEIDAHQTAHEQPEKRMIENARSMAFAYRPELKASCQHMSSLYHKLESIKSSNWPKISALGAWGRRDSDFLPQDEEWLFGLRMEMPIFTGFRLCHEENKARAEMLEAKADHHTLCLKIEQEIMTAYSKLNEAYELINTTEIQVADAKESRRLTEERYKAGVSTLTDLLDSQTALLQAEASNVNAEWNFEAAAAYFLWVQGVLSESFCVN